MTYTSGAEPAKKHAVHTVSASRHDPGAPRTIFGARKEPTAMSAGGTTEKAYHAAGTWKPA